MSSKPPIVQMPSESSPKDTEVEYALILSQMIEVAEEDPSQLRLAIYEFARTKLINNTLDTAEAERARLSKSLEAAIVGVEKFAKLRGDNGRRIVFRHGGAELSDDLHPVELPPALQKTIADAAGIEAQPPTNPASHLTKMTDTLSRQISAWGRQLNWFAVGLFCFVAAIVLIVLVQRSTLWRGDRKARVSVLSAQKADNSTPAGSTQAPPEPLSKPSLRLPLPENYGVYLVNGSELLELEALETRVPDRRIEMSTPVSSVHQTAIADRAPRFLIYRRDFANDPADKFEVRPLARIERAISFDQKGKAVFSPSASTWIIRNIAYEFRVRPVPGHPEMLLVQARDGAELSSGRYVLAVKDKGFDFIVTGEPTDPAQCVERTEAVNGTFYSDCQKR